MKLLVDKDRLWKSLEEHGAIGGTELGGVNREALTEIEGKGREVFVEWCKSAGMDIAVDTLGNIYATRRGLDSSLKPVAMGSHLDTQPTGGKYDGVIGVLGGLEVVRVLNDANIVTNRPLQIVVWTNEEGSRFVPSMAGSGVYAGIFEEQDILNQKDGDGITIDESLKAIGYKGDEAVGAREFHAFIELHIEQGPVLESKNMEVGVVTGSQAMNWSDVTVKGVSAHAGTTPMSGRLDALASANRLLSCFYDLGNRIDDACATIGSIKTIPNSHSTIPNTVAFTLDLRHPDEAVLEAMVEKFEMAMEGEREKGFEVTREEFGVAKAQVFDQKCTETIRNAAAEGGFRHCDIISGAGHDAIYINQVCPSGMIFIPCKDGVSHNPKESITPEEANAGVQVLLDVVVALAD